MTTWKPGDIAEVTFNNATGRQREQGIDRIETKRALVVEHEGASSGDRLWFVFGPATRIGVTWEEVVEAAPLLVIDPSDIKQIDRLYDILAAYSTTHDEALNNSLAKFPRAHLTAGLLAFMDPPKPYREYVGSVEPWPVVGECHSSHVDGHECPQCSWEHAHDWVEWVHPLGTVWPSNAVPIRCSKCGARKCDQDLCDERRHDHNHQAFDESGAL